MAPLTPSRPSLKALLIDLSGTLHIGKEPTPHAVAAVQRLRSHVHLPFRFCSNTSKESTEDLRRRLREIGFDVKGSGSYNQSDLPKNNGRDEEEEEIYTSIGALKRLVASRGLQNPFYILSDSARNECVSYCTSNSGLLPGGGEEIGETYDAVIVGLAPEQFNYDTLNKAFRILVSSSSPPLIATHLAKYMRTADLQLSLGPGPFVKALEEASGVRAEVVGKPSGEFFKAVISSMNMDVGGEGEAKVAVIGDDVEADLGGGAVEMGLWRVLVKTGKYRSGDESRPGVVPPDEVCDSFASFVDSLLGPH